MNAHAVRLAVASVALLTSVAAARATEHAPALTLDGMLVDNVQLLSGSSTARLRITLDRVNTAAEADHFAELLRERGALALQSALYEDPIGRLEIGDRLGWPIGYAQKLVDANGSHLVLLAQRPVSFAELVRGARARDYLYTAVLIDLGDGDIVRAELLPAAKIRFLGDGTVDLVNLVEQPMPILGLRKPAS